MPRCMVTSRSGISTARGTSGTLQLTDYKTHITSNFSTGLAKTLRPRTLNCIKWLASAICSCRCNRQLRNEPHQGCNGGWQDVGPWGYQIVQARGNGKRHQHVGNKVAAQLVMALSFFASMREGEIQGLQWNDLDADFIHIRRASSRGVVGTPKSKKSRRPSSRTVDWGRSQGGPLRGKELVRAGTGIGGARPAQEKPRFHGWLISSGLRSRRSARSTRIAPTCGQSGGFPARAQSTRHSSRACRFHR